MKKGNGYRALMHIRRRARLYLTLTMSTLLFFYIHTLKKYNNDQLDRSLQEWGQYNTTQIIETPPQPSPPNSVKLSSLLPLSMGIELDVETDLKNVTSPLKHHFFTVCDQWQNISIHTPNEQVDLTRVYYKQHPESDARLAVYYNAAANELIFVAPGTDFRQIGDLTSVAMTILQAPCPRLVTAASMIEDADSTLTANGINISTCRTRILGHSAGARLALMIALYINKKYETVPQEISIFDDFGFEGGRKLIESKNPSLTAALNIIANKTQIYWQGESIVDYFIKRPLHQMIIMGKGNEFSVFNRHRMTTFIDSHLTQGH